ncbi:O-methyltransferase [Oceanobacillus massiliensis]|uniref:O-methyltransferase n=1 Tax=Oceanobacillus massiliensis TaxID=1465765 RepID=UPI000289F06C|nr:O-methyltransferase [Oceanobacillus massiliensis]
MNEKLKDYLTDTLPLQADWVVKLEEMALAENVPIMDKAGINLVMQLIRISRPHRILEIGTAIGYSALRMLEAAPDASIVTIEKDEHRYAQAMEHIRELNKEQQIEVIYGDALDKLQQLSENGSTFDLLFIDAAKGQYQRFFELAEPMLNPNGMIISDNVLFRGFVANPEDVPKRYTKMVEKIRSYNQMLMSHPDFTTSIIPIGDGVAVSYKKS